MVEKSKSTKLDQKHYAKIGELVVPSLEASYFNKRQIYITSLIKGFLGGLGSVLGATIGIALFLGLLSLFEELPFIDDIVRATKSAIETKK